MGVVVVVIFVGVGEGYLLGLVVGIGCWFVLGLRNGWV